MDATYGGPISLPWTSSVRPHRYGSCGALLRALRRRTAAALGGGTCRLERSLREAGLVVPCRIVCHRYSRPDPWLSEAARAIDLPGTVRCRHRRPRAAPSCSRWSVSRGGHRHSVGSGFDRGGTRPQSAVVATMPMLRVRASAHQCSSSRTLRACLLLTTNS